MALKQQQAVLLLVAALTASSTLIHVAGAQASGLQTQSSAGPALAGLGSRAASSSSAASRDAGSSSFSQPTTAGTLTLQGAAHTGMTFATILSTGKTWQLS
jgi:hypothetical protein